MHPPPLRTPDARIYIMHVLIRARAQKSKFRANSLGTYACSTRARVDFCRAGLIDLGPCAIFCRLRTRSRLHFAICVVLDERTHARTNARTHARTHTMCLNSILFAGLTMPALARKTLNLQSSQSSLTRYPNFTLQAHTMCIRRTL